MAKVGTRAQFETDFTPLEDMVALVEEQALAIQLAGEETAAITLPALIEDLRTEPPPSQPGNFRDNVTSLKQLRYVMANIIKKGPDGKPLPYQRTHKASQSWNAQAIVSGDSFDFAVTSTFPQSRFLGGSLALSNLVAAARFQQKFHEVTGWQLYAETVRIWFELAQEDFANNLNELIGEIGTPKFRQRGFTPRLSKKRK